MFYYTIYCTPEQTKKALELGAPIQLWRGFESPHGPTGSFIENNVLYFAPTAEQMIGWIEGQGVLCDVFPTGDFGNDGFGMRIMKKAKRLNRFESDDINYPSRPEATLAAIDAALEYLIKNNKKL